MSNEHKPTEPLALRSNDGLGRGVDRDQSRQFASRRAARALRLIEPAKLAGS